MPSFSTNVKNEKGCWQPIVDVLVADASKLPSPDETGQRQTQSVQLERCYGLIDTGATVSCVTEELAKQLALKPLGTYPVTSASETRVEKNIYRLMIAIAVEGRVLKK